MTAPFKKGFSTAYKRARSHDSPTPLASPPVPKATKIEDKKEVEESEEASRGDSKLPAFLRQSQAAIWAKFQDILFREHLRIHHGRNDPCSEWLQDLSSLVTKRNRYNNVLPWAKSRIHLKVEEGKSDYINASPISLRDPRTGVDVNYITTQGPKRSGISHFWQMVWQETVDVAVVIMLTRTHDGSMEKCFQYFPLNADSGPYKVDPIDGSQGALEGSISFVESTSEVGAKIEIRRLCLKFGEETRDVWHFLFSEWADHAAPANDDRVALLELLKLSAEKNVNSGNPRVIHCSAGVGRSGTFIALEYLLAQVESGDIANLDDDTDFIYDVVNHLREQRMLMVQSEVQYQFLYDVVREEYQRRQIALASASHSPKLRKLASGMKAALIRESDIENDLPHGSRVDQIQVETAEEEESANGQILDLAKDNGISHP